MGNQGEKRDMGGNDSQGESPTQKAQKRTKQILDLIDTTLEEVINANIHS